MTKRLKPVLLDIGCGAKKTSPLWMGMDKRKMPGVDIVHDLEVFPYPIQSDSVTTIVASHILEHLKPWLTVDVFNELWRILKPEGQLALGVPYGVSEYYVQDPTHCNPFNETTLTYFDPRPDMFGWKEVKDHRGIYEVVKEGHVNRLYAFYEPKPWKIVMSTWKSNGNMEAILEKRKQ